MRIIKKKVVWWTTTLAAVVFSFITSFKVASFGMGAAVGDPAKKGCGQVSDTEDNCKTGECKKAYTDDKLSKTCSWSKIDGTSSSQCICVKS